MTPPFQPKAPLRSVFTCATKIGRIERQFDVFQWEDRLAAHEEASGLWWGTLDACGDCDIREFWHRCVEDERVGRLLSRRRGFQMSRDNGATLLIKDRLFHLLVAQDNSGTVRVDDVAAWHPFSAVEPWSVRKPSLPTIWSRSFLTKFALRGWGALNPVYENEALKVMPEAVGSLWWQGAGALPLRLVGAATALGWAGGVRGPTTLRQFWQDVLRGRSTLPKASPRPQMPVSFLVNLLHSPEVALPGEIAPSHDTTTFIWQNPGVTLRIEFQVANNSAHEQLESSLELRDWLTQFFPSPEVESWFRN